MPTGVRFTEIDDVHAKLRSASAAIMKIGADRSRHPSEPTPQVEIAIAKAHGAMSPGNFDALSNVSSPRPNYHAASFHQHYADTDWVTVAVCSVMIFYRLGVAMCSQEYTPSYCLPFPRWMVFNTLISAQALDLAIRSAARLLTG